MEMEFEVYRQRRQGAVYLDLRWRALHNNPSFFYCPPESQTLEFIFPEVL